MIMKQTQHVPVMMDEVLTYLQPTAGGIYIDGTLGGGGHTRAILERSSPDGRVLGIDTDCQAIARVREQLADYVEQGRLLLAHGNFADMHRFAEEAQLPFVQGILLDLGFSSHQMDSPERGFSFNAEGPLDMRLNREQSITAADLVNTASEEELADIFWRYGEERRSRQVARRIVRERAKQALTTTAQLARLVAAEVHAKPGAIHPATRVFQALRIAVNQELERLTEALPHMLDLLSAGKAEGPAPRMVIISFHSLEDRIVKDFMRREATDCICPPRMPVCVCGHKARLRIVTSRPVVPGEQEVSANPRARSAKLRAAEVIVQS